MKNLFLIGKNQIVLLLNTDKVFLFFPIFGVKLFQV